MALKINLYKNKNQENRNYGKIYGRCENASPIGIRDLAAHISQHGSPYDRSTISGVLYAAADCIRELVLTGTPVKIDDLAIFTPSVISTPAATADQFDLGVNCPKVKMTCRSTGKSTIKELTKDASLKFTQMAERIRAGELVLSTQKGVYVEAT